MKICLYCDQTVDLRLDEIITNLNHLAPTLRFHRGNSLFALHKPFISVPQSYRDLNKAILRETAEDDEVFLFSNKPYDNNFFWESEGKYSIVSFSGWKQLTNLSQNNGVVYLVCAIILRGYFSTHRDKNTGCINDFWEDKTGIDIGMRTAYVCAKCIQNPRKIVDNRQARKLATEFTPVLNELSNASRANMDICDYWKLRKSESTFDVFICYNSQDKEAIRQINNRLKRSHVKTWWDDEQSPPGRSFQDALEEQITKIKTASVFVGQSGIGPWQNEEIKAFLREFVQRQCPIIPVILPDCPRVPDLPVFLRQFTWVDFRKSMPDPYKQLLWGIKGRKP